MGKVLRREELEILAHTVKTKDDKIWVNLYDGRFILRESIDWKKPVIRKTHNLYHQIECRRVKPLWLVRDSFRICDTYAVFKVLFKEFL